MFDVTFVFLTENISASTDYIWRYATVLLLLFIIIIIIIIIIKQTSKAYKMNHFKWITLKESRQAKLPSEPRKFT